MGDVTNLIDLLPIYYSRLFPFNDYYQWLIYSDPSAFVRREFSFTLQDDIYIRFQSFKNLSDLEAEIKRLVPFKIDIGAVYNVSPKDQRRDPMFQAMEREVVFDIDMTDYDEVRTCCKEADVCNKCWKFMALACKILDAAIRADFGYKHILWIFSGRRGIHCWVCDTSARSLSDIERSAVAEYLQIIGGGEHAKKKVSLSNDRIHPSIKRALDTIEPIFIPMCIKEQDILGTPERYEKFLSILPDGEDQQELKKQFELCSSGEARWTAFINFVNTKKKERSLKWYQYRHLVEEVMLQYSYPRLDINVTKARNHLLKSPFCVHPKTGKVCIPFTSNTVDKFDVDKVPTITTLIDEINSYDEKEKKLQKTLSVNAPNIQDLKKTMLNRSLLIFKQFIRGLKEEQKKENSKKNDKSLEF